MVPTIGNIPCTRYDKVPTHAIHVYDIITYFNQEISFIRCLLFHLNDVWYSSTQVTEPAELHKLLIWKDQTRVIMKSILKLWKYDADKEIMR